jgi:hypothetical protein
MTEQTSAAQPQREIPPLPGGGSWTFDEDKWAWVSNNPAPQPATAAADQAAAPIAAPAAEQPASEE